MLITAARTGGGEDHESVVWVKHGFGARALFEECVSLGSLSPLPRCCLSPTHLFPLSESVMSLMYSLPLRHVVSGVETGEVHPVACVSVCAGARERLNGMNQCDSVLLGTHPARLMSVGRIAEEVGGIRGAENGR